MTCELGDGSSGAAVSCLGHSNKKVRDAIKKQVDTLAYAHTSFMTNKPAEELAAILVKKAPSNIDKVYFLSGGSEAVETALKLVRQYHLENNFYLCLFLDAIIKQLQIIASNEHLD